MTEKMQKIQPDEFEYTALGYTIHNIYNLMENYFLRIAKFFENNIEGSSWHKDLLERMCLDIPTIRPALLTKENAKAIGELRSFRHVFRNIYQSELDKEKIEKLNLSIPHTIQKFKISSDLFIEKLKQIVHNI